MDIRGRVAVGAVFAVVVVAAGGAALFGAMDDPSGGADTNAAAPEPTTTTTPTPTTPSTTSTPTTITSTTTPTPTTTTTTTSTTVRAGGSHDWWGDDDDDDAPSDDGTDAKTCATSVPNDTAVPNGTTTAGGTTSETTNETSSANETTTVETTSETSSANETDGAASAAPNGTEGNATLTVSLGEWADVETQNTTLGVQVTRYRTVEEIPSEDLRAEYRGSDLDAPAEKRWLVASVWLRNIGASRATVSSEQWSLTSLSERRVEPSSEATVKVRETLGTHEMGANTGHRYRVIFAVRHTADVAFTVEPREGEDGRTVRIVTD